MESARELGARLAARGRRRDLGRRARHRRGGASRRARRAAAGAGAAHTVAVLGTGIDVAYPERNAGHVRRDRGVGRRAGHAVRARHAAAQGIVPHAQRGHRRRWPIWSWSSRRAGVGHDAHRARDAARSAGRSRRCRDRTAPTRSSSRAPRSPSPAPMTCSRCSTARRRRRRRCRTIRCAAKIYAALDDVPRDVGELAFRAGLAVGTCAAMVVDLELGGLAARAAGGRYLRLR